MKILVNVFMLFCLFFTVASAEENELNWPREITTKYYQITMYQPQFEEFEDTILQGRMAVSIKPEGKEMLFCAAWFAAKMETDLDRETVTLKSIDITKIHFPDVEGRAEIDKISQLLKKEITSWDLNMSLDRFTASLSDIENLQTASEPLKNNPPDIYFRSTPTVLVTIDGKPILEKLSDTNLEYVVNTPFFIVGEKGKGRYYLNGGGTFWYLSEQITEGWKHTSDVPADIKKMAEENISKNAETLSEEVAVTAPDLLVVTKPSELILTDGQPQYQSVEGSSLLYVLNSESEIIMDVKSQNHYVLMAGRWYQSKTLQDGDWKFVEPSEVPKEFSAIPEKSAMATVRVSVPGTPEAHDALLEQSIPQTATVDRKTTTVEVKFDGEPEFQNVEGTEVAYAVNSDKTVLRIEKKFYCVDDGIWFISRNATGPWAVSDVRPDEVDKLPPSSPVYNVKYVYIYDSTPEVVYVGYYPGYCHSYVYSGVVVYGTGYYYRPWYRHYYYPRPHTYGFGVHWNSHTGWGFSFGYSSGWIGWGFHPYYRPYWGPRGYHYGYRHGYNHGYRDGARAGYRLGRRDSARPVQYNTVNVYNNRKTSIVSNRNVRTTQINTVNRTNLRPSTKPNDLFSDRQGNIYQRGKDGSWAERSNKPTLQPSRQYEHRPQVNRDIDRNNLQNRSIQQQQLNRSYQSRARGEMRVNRYGAGDGAGGRRR